MQRHSLQLTMLAGPQAAKKLRVFWEIITKGLHCFWVFWLFSLLTTSRDKIMGWIYHRCDTIQICSDWFDSGYWFLQSLWHRRMAESTVRVWMSPQLYFSRVQRGANCSVLAHVGRSSDLLPGYGDKASLLRWLSYYHPGFWSDADIIMVSGSNNSDSFYSVSLLVRWKLFSLHFGLLQ